MDKNKVLDYVTNTPGNTNRAVLSGMIDSISGGNDFPQVEMEVTPGMSFEFKCNYSYEDLMNFEDRSIVQLDETWTNGQTDVEYHGLGFLEKRESAIYIYTMPVVEYAIHKIYVYVIEAQSISRRNYTIDLS